MIKIFRNIRRNLMETGKTVYDLVLEQNILTKEKLDEILDPKNMLSPHDRIN